MHNEIEQTLSDECTGVLVACEVHAAIPILEAALKTHIAALPLPYEATAAAHADLTSSIEEIQHAINVLVAVTRRELWRV